MDPNPFEHFQLKMPKKTRKPRPPTKENCLAIQRPHLACDWHPINERLPDSYSFGCCDTVKWRCSTCAYEWDARIGNRSRGKGCPACAGRVITDRNRLSKQRPHLVCEWHPINERLPDSYSFGCRDTVKWRCSTCAYEWDARIDRRSRGDGCPACAVALRGCGTSQIEQRIMASIREMVAIPSGDVLPRLFESTSNIVSKVNAHYLTGFKRTLRPDLFINSTIFTKFQVIVEYDSNYCHKDTDSMQKDTAKTEILLQTDLQLVVVRIRELPLAPLNINNSRYFEVRSRMNGSASELRVAKKVADYIRAK